MITLTKSGTYKLQQTKKSHSKLLTISGKDYVWTNFENIGEILVATAIKHPTECMLAAGEFRIYAVQDEPYLNDNTHLELRVNGTLWQGYLLLTGLPNRRKTRARIIPTNERITGAYQHANKKELAAAHVSK